MCFRLKHFPAHHNDRTSLTPAVISEFKVHKMRQRPGALDPAGGAYSAPPGLLAGLGEGEGIRREGNRERKEGKWKGGERKGRGGGRGKGERGK